MKSTMQHVDLSILDILEHGAQNFGSTEVVARYEDGTRVSTFAEIRRQAASLSAGLRELGVGVGDRVGTFAWNTKEHLESYFAVPSMGAVLHTMNPRFSTEQLSWCVQDAQTSVAIVDSSLAEPFTELLERELPFKAVIIYENGEPLAGKKCERLWRQAQRRGIEVRFYSELVDAHHGEDAFQRVPEHAAAALCHTSGTTGNPKGVAYSHRSIWLHSLLNTSAAQFGLSSQDTILPAVPMFHVMGWNLSFSAFMVGSRLILTNRWNQAEPLLQLIAEQEPTFGAGVPTIWNDIAHRYEQGGESYDLSSLQRISSGGAAVPESLIHWWQQQHGITIFHGCGMTETSSTMTSGFPPGGIDLQELSPYQRTQGQFLIGVQHRIVDEEGRELPQDGETAGELQLRGPWITGAYLNRDEPAVTEDGWLPTGDIATITANGYLQYTDRSKDIIKSGGEWISSVALETRLVGHPGVHEAVVIGVDDARWQERPAAVVVCRGERPEISDLKAHLLEGFPKFWVPDEWIFVDEIPRTSVGKYDKKKLRADYRAGLLPQDS